MTRQKEYKNDAHASLFQGESSLVRMLKTGSQDMNNSGSWASMELCDIRQLVYAYQDL